MSFIVLSPDGFRIDFQVSSYSSKKKAISAFDEWKKRYETQGYYSSNNFGRIPLNELADYCKVIDSKIYSHFKY